MNKKVSKNKLDKIKGGKKIRRVAPLVPTTGPLVAPTPSHTTNAANATYTPTSSVAHSTEAAAINNPNQSNLTFDASKFYDASTGVTGMDIQVAPTIGGTPIISKDDGAFQQSIFGPTEQKPIITQNNPLNS